MKPCCSGRPSGTPEKGYPDGRRACQPRARGAGARRDVQRALAEDLQRAHVEDVTMLMHGARAGRRMTGAGEVGLLRGRYLVRWWGKRAIGSRMWPAEGGDPVLPRRSGGLATVATGLGADRNL